MHTGVLASHGQTVARLGQALYMCSLYNILKQLDIYSECYIVNLGGKNNLGTLVLFLVLVVVSEKNTKTQWTKFHLKRF